MSGGRPPFDSPSPRGLIRPAANKSPTTLVMVGALRPEARTRSAFEHEPVSRRSLRTLSAFVWRRSEGLPTEIDSFFNENRLGNPDENNALSLLDRAYLYTIREGQMLRGMHASAHHCN
jgi:hypothetical protein